jgi:hypothetical protein
MKAHDALPVTVPDRPPGQWAEWAAEAAKSPGVWFEVGVFHRTMVTHLRHGRVAGVNPERFEFASRKAVDAPPNHSRIFMRAI